MSLAEIFAKCETIWVPRWFREFSNPEGGFHERLDQSGMPIEDIPRRLLTQCRQIMVYSIYHIRNPNDQIAAKLHEAFQFIIKNYSSHTSGGFHFSINSSGGIQDSKYDLYGHAFVILACAAYYNAFHNAEALKVAKNTLTFIKSRFQLKTAPGLTEALDENLQPIPGIRRQNPHMHLMEACIYMFEACGDPEYLKVADDMLALFYSHLCIDGSIREFFDDQLIPHKETGSIVEAGHHAEWVWLLARYQEIKGCSLPKAVDTMATLFSWVANHGFDGVRGGIYNSQNTQGNPVDKDKRIWPVFEALRASAVMLHHAPNDNLAMSVARRAIGLIGNYVGHDGAWVEMMDGAMSEKSDYRPGTTPYHIYLPLLETCTKYRPE